MGKFLVNYRYRGAEYGFPIHAESWEDAEARLRALHTARIIGSDVQDIPVNAVTLPFAGALVRLIVWWRNRGMPR